MIWADADPQGQFSFLSVSILLFLPLGCGRRRRRAYPRKKTCSYEIRLLCFRHDIEPSPTMPDSSYHALSSSWYAKASCKDLCLSLDHQEYTNMILPLCSTCCTGWAVVTLLRRLRTNFHPENDCNLVALSLSFFSYLGERDLRYLRFTIWFPFSKMQQLSFLEKTVLNFNSSQSIVATKNN